MSKDLKSRLRYFKPYEFHGFWSVMDETLVLFLDEFRHRWGAPVRVSTAYGAVGRSQGRGFHNYKKHGSVKAIDILPSGLYTADDVNRALDILRDIVEDMGIPHWGFGLYPKWASGVGIHLDVGDRGKPDGFASWSALPTGRNGKQEYYGLERGIDEL